MTDFQNCAFGLLILDKYAEFYEVHSDQVNVSIPGEGPAQDEIDQLEALGWQCVEVGSHNLPPTWIF